MSAPVTKPLAFGLARKTAAPINSGGSPNRPIGVCLMTALARSVGVPAGLNKTRRFCSAGKKPGVMELTRTPLGAHSHARNCVRLSTAVLAAEYATTRESGMCAETLAMLMMLPWPRLTIAGPNSWQGNNTPPTKFRSKLARQSSKATCSKRRSGPRVTLGSFPPAAFTRIVGAPSDFSIC